MLQRSIARIVLMVLAAAVAVTAAGEPQTKGRYKKQGSSCVWAANDTGPNQCAPLTPGRFKKEGNNCVWAADDKGGDQCKPASGRFKKDGDRCVWTPNDSGPNQCNPRRVK